MNRSIIIAIAIAAVGAGWILSGQFGNGEMETTEAAESTKTDKTDGPPAVRVIASQSQLKARELTMLGRTEASRSVVLRAETAGRVLERAVTKGDVVKKGDVLVRLVRADRAARVTEAKARYEQQRIAYKAAKELSAKNFRSKVKLAEELAQLEAAKTYVETTRIDLERTVVRAPFAGVVEDFAIETGDYVKVGGDLAVIKDLDPLLATGELSEKDISQVSIGTRVGLRFPNGTTAHGRVSFLSRSATPGVHTFRVEVSIDNVGYALAEGLTTELRLVAEEIRAHKVSPAILTLSDGGVVGIKGVTSGGVVSFHPVQLVADEDSGVWLSGLPETLTIITVGQEFVRVGQTVRPVAEK